MATNISIKAYLVPEDFNGKDEIRRFALDANANYSYIREKLLILFPVLQRKPFNIVYKDDEGDMITVSSDEELKTACLTAAKDNLLRINIRRDKNGHHHQQRGKHERSPAPEMENEMNNGLHPRVTCDGCEGPIFGFRYKCVQCPDYDLCAGCEFKQMHSHHYMVRIPTADMASYMPMPPLHERHSSHRRHHWGHRRRHGNPFFSARKSTEADGSDDGPSDQDRQQYPFQFNQVLEKIWTALGGLPREPTDAPAAAASAPSATQEKVGTESFFTKPNQNAQEEYLNKVGNTVAAMLDPLGIDVDVYVTKDKVHNTEEGQQAEKEMAKESYSAASTVILRNPELFKVSEPEAVIVDKSPEKSLYPSLVQDLAMASKKNSETGDGWTYIDVEATKDATFRPSVEEESQRPKSTGPPTTSIANELDNMKLVDVPPPHSNRIIRSALDQMMSMGFTNEGGWLTQLLEVKNGNIDDVLEVLSPHSTAPKKTV